MRINKYLAECGVASRRGCDKLIEEGRVTVNGKTAALGDDIAGGEEICVDGVPVSHGEKHSYYLLNFCLRMREECFLSAGLITIRKACCS